MKLLVVIFASVLVAQLANAGVVGSSLDDVLEEYEDLQYIENTNVVSEDVPTTLRSCNNAACHNICTRLGFTVGTCISATICRCTK